MEGKWELSKNNARHEINDPAKVENPVKRLTLEWNFRVRISIGEINYLYI